jgi:DNA polymerase beta
MLDSPIRHNRTCSFIFEADVIQSLAAKGLIADVRRHTSLLWDGIIRMPERDNNEDTGIRLQAVKNLQGKYCNLRITSVVYFIDQPKCVNLTFIHNRAIPEKSLGAALLYYTGNEDFWTSLKAVALKQNLFLNRDGLWRWVRDDSGPEVSLVDAPREPIPGHWENVGACTEEAIFGALGLSFVRPEKRDAPHPQSRSRE